MAEVFIILVLFLLSIYLAVFLVLWGYFSLSRMLVSKKRLSNFSFEAAVIYLLVLIVSSLFVTTQESGVPIMVIAMGLASVICAALVEKRFSIGGRKFIVLFFAMLLASAVSIAILAATSLAFLWIFRLAYWN